LGHYPDLNQKELAVCEIIVSALWDIRVIRKCFLMKKK
jgi:hypothetical protein